MEQITTLRATNCTSLQPLGSNLVAACGAKTAYLLDTAERTEVGTCVAPRDATCYTLWLPPGTSTARDVVVVYATRECGAEDGYQILLQRQDEGTRSTTNSSQSTSTSVVRLALPEAPAGPLQSLTMANHTVLCVQTASAVAFYALDPANLFADVGSNGSSSSQEAAVVSVPKMGECTVPISDAAALPSTHILPSPTEPLVVVACVSGTRKSVHVSVVRISQGLRAVVEASTPSTDGSREGLALPQGAAWSEAEDLLAVRVWWARKELIVMYRRPGTTAAAAVVGLPLINAAGGSALTAWSKRPDAEPEFVTAATRPVLASATDLCCTASGDVWAVDSTTTTCVVLRNVTSAYLTEAEAPGSSPSAKVSVAADGDFLYAQVGRGIYMLSVAAEADATGEAEAATPGRRSTSFAPTNKSQPTAPVTAAAGSGAAGKTKGTLSDWLLAQQQQQQQKETVSTTETSAAELAANLIATGSASQRTHVDSVVRDVLFVARAHEPSVSFRHCLLEALQAKASGDALDRAVLRYAALAQSLHAFSVLSLLSHAAAPQQARKANDALLLAVAAFLSEKPALQTSGAFHRMAEQSAATRCFFTAVLPTPVEQKRFTAALCRTAVSALATGRLDAAKLLFAVADVSVAAVYGRQQQREAHYIPSLTTSNGIGRGSSAAATEQQRQDDEVEVRELEGEVATALAIMASYVEWALGAASTSLGMMTAHVGEPAHNKKEAALRDGRAHPIQTSRTIDIAPLQLPNRPANSLTTK